MDLRQGFDVCCSGLHVWRFAASRSAHGTKYNFIDDLCLGLLPRVLLRVLRGRALRRSGVSIRRLSGIREIPAFAKAVWPVIHNRSVNLHTVRLRAISLRA